MPIAFIGVLPSADGNRDLENDHPIARKTGELDLAPGSPLHRHG
jgi:hypothetical protein